MPDALPKRPALGQAVGLGALYDVRTDTFTRKSLFTDGPPDGAVDIKKIMVTNLQLHRGSSLKDRFSHLGVGLDLGVSFLAGLIPVNGYGHYLNDSQSNDQRHLPSSIHCTRPTIEEELNVTAPGIKESISLTAVDMDAATHVVAGITWGAQCAVTATQTGVASNHDISLEDLLASQFNRLKLEGLAASAGDSDSTIEQEQHNSQEPLELSFFSNISPEFGDMPTSFSDVQKFFREIPVYINTDYGGRGCPIAYTLLPLCFLSMFRILEVRGNPTVHQPSVSCLEGYVELFGNLHYAYEALEAYTASRRWYLSVVPQSHIVRVSDRIRLAKAEEVSLRKNLAIVLQQVRAGAAESDALQKLLKEFKAIKVSLGNLESLVSYADRMNFAETITREKAVYVGYGDPNLAGLLAQSIDKDAYVLYFNRNLPAPMILGTKPTPSSLNSCEAAARTSWLLQQTATLLAKN